METEIKNFKGKVAVATDNGEKVTGHIGRCKYFMIFDIDGGKITGKELRENSFTNHRRRGHHHGEGHGRHSHEHLVSGLKDCSYLISNGGGWRVVDDLKEHNIITLFTDTEMIDDAVNKFIKGELENREDMVCDGHNH